MYDGNPGEIDFGSSSREVRVIGSQLHIDFSKPKSGAHIRKEVIIILLLKIKMKEKESKPNDKKAMSMKTYFGNISF